MPKRSNLKKDEIDTTVQGLLKTHSPEDIFDVLRKLTNVKTDSAPVKKKVLTYREATSLFLESDLYKEKAETTQKAYKYETKALTSHLCANGISLEIPFTELIDSELSQFTTFIGKRKAENSKNTRKGFLRTFLRVGLRECDFPEMEIDKFLSRKIFHIPKVTDQTVRYLEPEHIAEILSLSFIGLGGFKNFAILIVLLCSGIRVSEVTQIKVGQVEEAEQILYVARKRNKAQLAPAFINEEGMQILKLFILTQYGHLGTNLSEIKKAVGQDHYVFFSYSGEKAISVRWLQEMVKRLVGLSKTIPVDLARTITPHSLRHTFAVTCMKKGVNIYSLMRFMNHSTLAMLQRYLKMTNKDYLDDLNKGSMLKDLLEGGNNGG